MGAQSEVLLVRVHSRVFHKCSKILALLICTVTAKLRHVCITTASIHELAVRNYFLEGKSI